MPAPTSRRGPLRVPSPFLGLQLPRLNPGCDGRRGRRDSRPVSSPQVGPVAARPARACGGSGAGRRPDPLSWDPRRKKGSPRTPTGTRGERRAPRAPLPGPQPGPHPVPTARPRARVPTRSPSAIPARSRPGPLSTHPIPVPGPAYRSGEDTAAARSPGPRRLLPPGEKPPPPRGPGASAWSLVPASARAAERAGCRARLLCEEGKAPVGFIK